MKLKSGRCLALVSLVSLLIIAIHSQAFASSVSLSWSDTSSNETGFKIERKPSGGSYSQIATVGSNVVSYKDSTVATGSSYCYQVRAYNSAGVSSPSNQVCANVPSASTTTTTSSSGGSTSGSTTTSSTTSTTTSTTLTSSSTATTTSTSTLTSPHGANWTDYRLTMRLKSADNGSLGAIFRYFNNDNYYRFSWNSYSSYRRLERKLNGTFQVLAEDAVPYVRKQLYLLEILVKGSALEIKIDGKVIFQGIDSSIPRGGIALYSWLNRGSIFEDVQVQNPSTGTVLFLDDFNDGNMSGWTIVDESTGSVRSVWSVSSGMAIQSANVGSWGAGQPGTYALY